MIGVEEFPIRINGGIDSESVFRVHCVHANTLEDHLNNMRRTHLLYKMEFTADKERVWCVWYKSGSNGRIPIGFQVV